MKTLHPLHLALSFFILFTFIVYAQEPTPNQNTSQVSKEVASFIANTDSLQQVKDLIKRTWQEDNDTVRTLAYHKLFLKRGVKTRDYKTQCYSGYNLGYRYYEKAAYQESMHYAKFTLKAAENTNDTVYIIRSKVLIGNIYFQLGIYDKALEPYQMAKDLSEQTGEKIYEIIGLTNISNVRVKLGRDKDALKVYNSTLDLLQQDGYKESPIAKQTRLSTLLGKGKSQTKLGDLDAGMATYQEGVRLAAEYNMNYYQGDFFVNMGNVLYKKEQYQEAMDYLSDAKKIFDENYGETYVNTLIANYYLAQCKVALEKHDEALALLTHNFDVIGTNYKTDKVEEMYDLGIAIAEHQGNKDQQLFFLTNRKQISNLKLENQTKSRDLLFEGDVKELEDDNKQLSLEKNKSVFKKKVAAIIAIGLGILLLLTLFMYRRKIKINENRFQAIIEGLQNASLGVATSQNSPSESVVKDVQAQEILTKLSELEDSEFFIAKDCNLYTTAKLIDTNTTYLSKTLNTVKKQSFNQYLNELRIRYALIQLKENNKFRAYTIKAISEEVGYKSVNTFIKAFKIITGLSPSYYIKELRTNVPI